MELNQYRAGKREQGLLKFVILVLTVALIAEGFFLIELARRQRIVLVPPGLGEVQEGWISDRQAGPEYLKQMTRFLLPLVTSFHPRTLDPQLSLFLHHVAPEQYGSVKAQLLSQGERAVKNDLSQVFYIQEVEVKGNIARATGLLKRFVGKNQTSEEVMTYEISYEIRHGRPYVAGIVLTPTAGIGASNRHRE